MGSSASRLLSCVRTSSSSASVDPPPLDETLGHSFCYLRSSSLEAPSSDTTFLSISGASVSANSSAPLPIHSSDSFLPSSHFHSSSSFSALPLQLATSATDTSAPLDRGFFLSGPIERGALSGPLDPVQFSGPLVSDKQKPKSLSKRFRRRKAASFSLKRCASDKNHRPWVVPIPNGAGTVAGTGTTTGNGMEGVQWAHGKAGEDRVHVVISEEHKWLFVGIYDGFNGPDAPDFLVSHLYQSLHVHLRGLFCEEEGEVGGKRRGEIKCENIGRQLWQFLEEDERGLEFSGTGRFAFSLSKIRYDVLLIKIVTNTFGIILVYYFNNKTSTFWYYLLALLWANFLLFL